MSHKQTWGCSIGFGLLVWLNQAVFLHWFHVGNTDYTGMLVWSLIGAIVCVADMIVFVLFILLAKRIVQDKKKQKWDASASNKSI